MESMHPVPYAAYWKAWAVLLVLTLMMIFISHPAILVGGILVKAAIITALFMHLRWERMDFALGIVFATLLTALVLYLLILPDARLG